MRKIILSPNDCSYALDDTLPVIGTKRVIFRKQGDDRSSRRHRFYEVKDIPWYHKLSAQQRRKYEVGFLPPADCIDIFEVIRGMKRVQFRLSRNTADYVNDATRKEIEKMLLQLTLKAMGVNTRAGEEWWRAKMHSVLPGKSTQGYCIEAWDMAGKEPKLLGFTTVITEELVINYSLEQVLTAEEQKSIKTPIGQIQGRKIMSAFIDYAMWLKEAQSYYLVTEAIAKIILEIVTQKIPKEKTAFEENDGEIKPLSGKLFFSTFAATAGACFAMQRLEQPFPAPYMDEPREPTIAEKLFGHALLLKRFPDKRINYIDDVAYASQNDNVINVFNWSIILNRYPGPGTSHPQGKDGKIVLPRLSATKQKALGKLVEMGFDDISGTTCIFTSGVAGKSIAFSALIDIARKLKKRMQAQNTPKSLTGKAIMFAYNLSTKIKNFINTISP